MNARSQMFELVLESNQVEEAVLAIFHPIIFHRSFGKFSFQSDSSYVMGTIGFEDVDCDFIDYTYVKTQSDSLDQVLRKEIKAFSKELMSPNGGQDKCGQGQVSLEFYQRRHKWPFATECIPWEVWTVKTEVVNLVQEEESVRRAWREKVGEILSDKVLYVAEVMHRHDYVPKIPAQADLDLIFDTSLPDVQPYLFKVSYATSGPSRSSVKDTVRRLLKDTLAI